MSPSISAQLIIGPIEGRDVATPEFDGGYVTFEIGVPKGRLQATSPSGKKMWLRLYVEDPMVPDVLAPTIQEVQAAGVRWIQILGLTPAGEGTTWNLYADHASVDEYEAFLARLEKEGCTIIRQPPG